MTTAREIMTSAPTIVGIEASAAEISRMLADQGIGAVVICNEAGRLQGVVSDRDLSVGVVAAGADPDTMYASDLVDGSEVVTIGADDTVEDAIVTMKHHAVRRLPVIDGRRVVGMLTQSDLAGVADDAEMNDLLATLAAAEDNTLRG